MYISREFEELKNTLIRVNKVNRELNFSATWPLRCHTASHK